MRFAGQRFRNPSGSVGRFQAEDGSIGDFKYRYQAQGLPQSRAAMPELNIRSMSKVEEPDFVIGSFAEPDFQI